MRRSLLQSIAAASALLLTVTVLAACCGPGADTVATVNGTPIARSQVDTQLGQMKKSSPATFSGTEGKKREQEFRAKILESLIQVELLRQGAKAMNIQITQKQVDAYLKNIQGQYGGAKGLADALKQAGTDLATLRQTAKDRLLVDAVTKKLQTTSSFTEKQMLAYYDQNKSLFSDREQVHIEQILLKSSDKKLADSLYAQVKGGADFAKLAAKYSVDPGSKTRGGDLGWASPTKYMPPISSKLGTMRVGDVALVQTQYGWHVFRLLGKKGATVRSYADVKDQIKQILQGRVSADAFTRYLDGLRKKAKIEILDAELKKLIEGPTTGTSQQGQTSTSTP